MRKTWLERVSSSWGKVWSSHPWGGWRKTPLPTRASLGEVGEEVPGLQMYQWLDLEKHNRKIEKREQFLRGINNVNKKNSENPRKSQERTVHKGEINQYHICKTLATYSKPLFTFGSDMNSMILSFSRADETSKAYSPSLKYLIVGYPLTENSAPSFVSFVASTAANFPGIYNQENFYLVTK